MENVGYGIVASEEGSRFLNQLHTKQSKGEGERGLLCKIWNGTGDSTTLAGTEKDKRSFIKSGLSICLFVQPDVIIRYLPNFQQDDGLVDRFLFFVHHARQLDREEVGYNII